VSGDGLPPVASGPPARRPPRSVRSGASRAALFVAALGLAWLESTPASAYVRYLSKKGNPYAWQEQCVWMLIYPHGLDDMTAEDVYSAEHAAQATWSHGERDCTYMQIIDSDVPADIVPPLPSYDLTNTTVFHSDAWCRTGAASTGADCYDPTALAITSVWTTSDGRIYDADIEVNAVNFRWTNIVDPASPPPGFQDLQNTLTHETGHLLGLDHTCFMPDPSGKTQEAKDNLGQPVPLCSALGPEDPIRATTMYPSAIPGDTKKRVLSADEIQAVCDIYPMTKTPLPACVPPTTMNPPPAQGGCSVAPGSHDVLPVAGFVGFLGVVVLRRRQRR